MARNYITFMLDVWCSNNDIHTASVPILSCMGVLMLKCTGRVR